MCTKPMKLYWHRDINEETGCRKTTPKWFEALATEMWFYVPCGQCINCLYAKSNEWALKADKEAKMHEKNAFLTISYMDSWAPKNWLAYPNGTGVGSLQYSDIQKLWKRMRKDGIEFRYLACSEYGPMTLRPHYHAIMFGYYPDDCYFWKNENGHDYFRSPTLEKYWQDRGMIIIAEARGDVMGYVAKYHTKLKELKVPDGFWEEREAEKLYMSRNPGIGIPWLEKYWPQVARHNAVEYKGRLMPIPRTFCKWLTLNQPEIAKRLYRERMVLMWNTYMENPEKFQIKKLKQRDEYLTNIVRQKKKSLM